MPAREHVEMMLEMRYEGGMTLEQIAAETGVTRQRVHQLIGNTGRITWQRRREKKVALALRSARKAKNT